MAASRLHGRAAVLPQAAFGGGTAAAAASLAHAAASAQQHLGAALVGPSSPTLTRLSAATTHDQRPVLVLLEARPDGALRVAVHAEDVIGGNVLLDELRAVLISQ